MEKCYKIKDVCKILSVSRTTIYNWLDEGKINIVRINGLPRITESELERLKKGE